MTDVVVTLPTNSVRGRVEDGIAVFRGIPYTAAPAGPARFEAPPSPLLSAPAWTGEFDATRFGPTAPQADINAIGLSAIVGTGWAHGDDYLNLNIWTPDTLGGLPVMVFIHGGAFAGGSGAAAGYDGTRFAEHGVVLVTINYRLGAPGFLRLPGARDNRGLLDQLVALNWVHRHIAAFGGDPDNITVFGESAGAICVASLLTLAPGGLFRRAIAQSGAASHALTATQADLVTAALADKLGVPATREAFANLPDRALVDAVAQLAVTAMDLNVPGARDPLMGLSKFGPVIDGETFSDQPLAAIGHRDAPAVDLLTGSNSDEMNLYLVGLPVPFVTEPLMRAAVTALHPDPDTVITEYRMAGRGETPAELLSAIGTDYMFAVPARRLADAHATGPGRTYRYEFTWASPARDGSLGACHGLELPFVFDNTDRVDYGMFDIDGDDEQVRALAAATHAAWIAFATHGDPGWPEYTTDTPAVAHIGAEWTTGTAQRAEQSVWDGIR